MINQDSYNRIFKKWSDYKRERVANPCIAKVSKLIHSRGSVLDIGCGTGYPIDSYLCSKGFSVVGIDYSEKMIEIAKEANLENASYICIDFLDYETDEKFDAVIAFDSVWHISLESQKLIYPKVSGLLKQGGYFLFTHGKEHGTVEGEMFDEHFVYSALDKEELRNLLSENGFLIEWFIEDYQDEVTGTRDLLVLCKKA